MNISASNSVNPNLNTSFGREVSFDDSEKIIILGQDLKDSFKKNAPNGDDEAPEKKSIVGVCTSVTVAVLSSFVAGKCLALKMMTAFPSLTPKLTNVVRKNADFVKNYADDVVNGVKMQKGGKAAKVVASKVAQAENFARGQFVKLRDKVGIESAVGTIAGAAAAAAISPEIISVDGNNDGVADIAQKNVNAYRNAAQNIGIVSEIVSVLA